MALSAHFPLGAGDLFKSGQEHPWYQTFSSKDGRLVLNDDGMSPTTPILGFVDLTKISEPSEGSNGLRMAVSIMFVLNPVGLEIAPAKVITDKPFKFITASDDDGHPNPSFYSETGQLEETGLDEQTSLDVLSWLMTSIAEHRSLNRARTGQAVAALLHPPQE